MILLDIPKKTCNKLFKWFFRLKYQKKKSQKSLSRPGPLTAIVIGLTWSVITSVNSAKTILLLLELLSLTKFHLQLLFFGIISTSADSNTKRS